MKPRTQIPYRAIIVKVKLRLLAKHYLPSKYDSTQECPIANACRDAFGSPSVHSEVSRVILGKIAYTHRKYTLKMYEADMKKAKGKATSNALIRAVILTKVTRRSKQG